MSSIAGTTDSNQPRRVPDAEYELAFALADWTRKAAASPLYCLALLEAHISLGFTKNLPSLLRAIDARRNNGGGEVVAA